MLIPISIATLLWLRATSATRLFASSYAGNITSLQLTEKDGGITLSATNNATECGPNPSWLTIDSANGLLFCVNEGLSSPNGSVSSFKINLDGSLSNSQNTTSLPSPVNALIYGNPSGKRGIVTSHYGGSGISAWNLKDAIQGDAAFDHIQDTLFSDVPGAIPDRQPASRPHQAVVDPTGKYILVPDLGSDQVRTFAWNTDNLQLNALDSLQTAKGAGPRNAVFWNPNGIACEICTTFLYVVNELSGTLSTYRVEYRDNNAGMRFEEKNTQNVTGYLATPQVNAPSHAVVSPDNRYLIVSSRNDTSFLLPNQDTTNNTLVASDSISTFALSDDGTAKLVQVAPAYGSYPRHFSINKAGNFIAVGHQKSSEVVILKRDVMTGWIGEPVARLNLEGEITSVVFNE